MDRRKSGFTLLEVIIVIIILGVLASLALPRFFRTVEYSKGAEALANLGNIRQSMYRCYLMQGNDYTGCNDIANLDIDDPTAASNYFTYTVDPATITPTTFDIQAQSKSVPADTIRMDQDGVKTGAGIFVNIKD